MEKLKKRKKKASKGPEYEIGAREKGFLKPKSGQKWQKIQEKKIANMFRFRLKKCSKNWSFRAKNWPKIAKKRRKTKKARKGPEYEILKNWAEN